MKNEIVIYQPDDLSTRIDVRIEDETVWLNRQQIATLFGRDVKTIGKHINNALKEELQGFSTVAKFATVQNEGGRLVQRQIEYYNLDVIISVGYRVKSRQGVQFRIWANKILKDYLLKGYALNNRINRIEDNVHSLIKKVDEIDLQLKTELLLKQHKKGLMQNLFPQEGEKVPKLRFPEFKDDGEWQMETFGKIYAFKTTNSFSRNKLNYDNGTVKNIHYGDIHMKFSTLFDITKENVPYINSDVHIDNINQDNYCIEGDMIFADASEDIDDVGKSIEIINVNNEKLLSGLHTFLARQIEPKLIIGFGGYLFKSVAIRNQIKNEAQGAKVLGISKSRMLNIKIYYPKSKQEQQKIAACLSSLDELIEARKQKLELLKQHKKGLMQNLFPQEGEKVPKLRFPEFKDDGEWKIKPLGNLSKKITEKTKGRKFKLMSITAGEGLVSQIEKFGREIAGNSYKNYYVIHKNDFAYNKSSTKYYLQGEIAMYEDEEIGAVPNSIFTCFRFNEQIIHPVFAKYHFINNLHGKWLLNFITIGARAHGALQVNEKDLFSLPFPFPFPSIPEQQKIAECLSSLDEIITAEAEKIEQLEKHKKGLMQGLFPEIN